MTESNEKQFDNSERYRDLGYAISYYRKRKGLTQEQVAERIGISRQHMGAIEAPNIVRAISMDVLFNIATVLEIEPYILLKFSPENKAIPRCCQMSTVGLFCGLECHSAATNSVTQKSLPNICAIFRIDFLFFCPYNTSTL